MPTLGYWKIRGLAAPIRYLLEFVGAEYDERLYECKGPPDFDRSEWLDEKFTLGLDFPNLPYYIDEQVKLSQSSVIMRYLARKYNLLGNTPVQQLRVDLLNDQLRDLHKDLAMTCYNPKFKELRDDFFKSVPEKLKLYEQFLGDNKFAAGDDVTYVDFYFYELIEMSIFLVADCLKDLPKLRQYHERMSSLEAIQKYWNSDKAIKYPFFWSMAYLGGDFSDQLIKTI